MELMIKVKTLLTYCLNLIWVPLHFSFYYFKNRDKIIAYPVQAPERYCFQVSPNRIRSHTISLTGLFQRRTPTVSSWGQNEPVFGESADWGHNSSQGS